MKWLAKYSSTKASLIQAVALVAYIFLVSSIFWRGQYWFGNVNNFLGPVLLLTIFSFSVLICGFIVFGYPIQLFFIENKKKKAIKVVLKTTSFFFVFLILVVLTIILSR